MQWDSIISCGKNTDWDGDVKDRRSFCEIAVCVKDSTENTGYRLCATSWERSMQLFFWEIFLLQRQRSNPEFLETKLWEALFRPGCQGPQRKLSRIFIHDIMEVEGVGQQGQQGDLREDEEGQEENGGGEETRSNAQSTHESWRWPWDERRLLLEPLEPHCMHLNKENSHGTMTLTDNQEERLKNMNLQCMMTLHWHQLRSQTSRVFSGFTSPIVGLFVLQFVSSIQLLLPYPFSSIFDLYENYM